MKTLRSNDSFFDGEEVFVYKVEMQGFLACPFLLGLLHSSLGACRA